VVLEVLDTEDRSESAINDAIVNAEARADIAGCGFVTLTSVGVTVAMVTSPSASAVACISLNATLFRRCYNV